MDAPQKKRLIISAVNFTEGGPLTVLQDCLKAVNSQLDDSWEIFALVNNHQVTEIARVTTIAFPMAKKSWFIRLYYEWWHFNEISKDLQPDIWLSLHDITPRVISKRRFVYCHNPSPFYTTSWQEILLDPSFFLFTQFYKFVYQIGIKSNSAVIVQQEWLRNQFKNLFHAQNIIVAHPSAPAFGPTIAAHSPGTNPKTPFIFLYPSLPRVFKNMEVLCLAAQYLSDAIPGKFEIRMTLDGTENKYAAHLIHKYAGQPGLVFMGRQSRSQMEVQYSQANCVVFPSRLETWGLGITEAKRYGKPILAADLPYAHETVGNCEAAAFFDPNAPKELAELMKQCVCYNMVFSKTRFPKPMPPFAENWDILINQLVEGI